MRTTREEAIKILQHLVDIMQDGSYRETFKMAGSALRGPTREQVEKMKTSLQNVDDDDPLVDYGCCGRCGAYVVDGAFCSECGSPLTDEAVDMVMKRLEELQND